MNDPASTYVDATVPVKAAMNDPASTYVDATVKAANRECLRMLTPRPQAWSSSSHVTSGMNLKSVPQSGLLQLGPPPKASTHEQFH